MTQQGRSSKAGGFVAVGQGAEKRLTGVSDPERSCDSFYRFKQLYETGGEAALTEMSRRGPQLRNGVAARSKRRSWSSTVEQPTWGQVRVANELAKRGLEISPSGVRTVWQRHDMENMNKRLRHLESRKWLRRASC